MCKMTPAMCERAIKIMQKINAHPCSRICLQIDAGDGLETTDLNSVTSKLLTGEYQTIGEWKKDMRMILGVVENLHGKDSIQVKCAQNVYRLFEKKCEKFVSFSIGRWRGYWNDLNAKLDSLFATMPKDLIACGMAGMTLLENSCTISPLTVADFRAASRRRKVEMIATKPAEPRPPNPYPFMGSPIEPMWMSEPEVDSDPIDFTESDIPTWHTNMFYDELGVLLGSYAEPEEEDFPEAVETVFTSPETSQAQSPACPSGRGKSPRQASEGGKVHSMIQQPARIKVRRVEPPPDEYVPNPVQRRKPRTPPSPKKEITDDEGEKKPRAPVRRKTKPGRGRGRGRRSHSFTSSESTSDESSDTVSHETRWEPPQLPPSGEVLDVPPLEEGDYEAFMDAAAELNSQEDAYAMAQIILRYDPTVNLSESEPEVDVANLQPFTVHQLIEYVRDRFRSLGLAYPEPHHS